MSYTLDAQAQLVLGVTEARLDGGKVAVSYIRGPAVVRRHALWALLRVDMEEWQAQQRRDELRLIRGEQSMRFISISQGHSMRGSRPVAIWCLDSASEFDDETAHAVAMGATVVNDTGLAKRRPTVA